MRPLLLAALMLAAFAGSCRDGGDSGVSGGFPVGNLTDEEAVRQLHEHGFDLIEAGGYAAIYELMAPDARELCPLPVFERAGRFATEIDSILRSAEGDGDIVSVVVEGDQATVTYKDYSPARDEFDEETDHYVKIDGRWFGALDPDDEEETAVCTSDMFQDDASADATTAIFRFVLLHDSTHGDPALLQALGGRSFSSRFMAACPFDRFLNSEGAAMERLRSFFEDPFAWSYRSSEDEVTVLAGQESVARLVSEGGSWRIDSLAGLIGC